jgi:hypothetical protein
MFRAVMIALVAGTIQSMMPVADEPTSSSEHLLASFSAEAYGYDNLVSDDG